MWNLKTKTKLINTENRLVVAKGEGGGNGKMGNVVKRYKLPYKIRKLWGSNVQHGDSNIALYI